MPPAGKRRDGFRVGLRDALDGPDELEVLGPDVRDHDHVRPRDRAERGDLAEPAHPHLRDEDLRVGLEPQHGERQADLVVEAPLRPHRSRVRRAERAEDVLRRGLAGGAHDRDDRRAALRADEGGERREGGVLVAGDERRRTPPARVRDVLDAGVQRDEEGSRSSRAGVGDDGADRVARLASVEDAEVECLHLLPGERDQPPSFRDMSQGLTLNV